MPPKNVCSNRLHSLWSLNSFRARMVVKSDGLNHFNIQSESDAIMDRHRLDYQQKLRQPRPISSHIIREDAHRNVYVAGCSELEVKTVEDALRIFSIGHKRRRTGTTIMNNESSRSHCIFIIRLVRTGYDEQYDEAIEDKSLLVVSQLCIVDLAGSERANRTGTHGSRLKEASGINNSLMNLRKCIEILRENQSLVNSQQSTTATPSNLRMVPYRDQRLTHLFKNFFEGDGRVVMLICIRSLPEDFDENMHVLSFAETSQEVSTFRYPVTPSSASRRPAKKRTRASASPLSVADLACPWQNDAKLTSIMDELSHLDTEVNKTVKFIFKTEPQLVDPGDTTASSVDLSEDSAPEPDRRPCARIIRDDYSSIDLDPLRALLNRRMERRKLASKLVTESLSHLQSLLNDDEVRLSSVSATGNGGSTLDCGERMRLESKIRHLENERLEHMREVEYYKDECGRLRAEIDHAGRATPTQDTISDTKGHPMAKRPRASGPRTNMVSLLSRQWESRLAATQANGTSGKPRRAAFNPRHRRSKSGGGGKVLEHQEKNNVPLGTIFTPKLGRRKSVTHLELKDTLKADSYLLHHQEADANGNVETKLYKGSVIPTAGGGSAVILNDVEVLRQTSPSK